MKTEWEKLEALMAEATPGPWREADSLSAPGVMARHTVVVEEMGLQNDTTNAAAIVALHNAWPRIQAAIQAARGLVQECDGCMCPEHIAVRDALAAMDVGHDDK